MEIGKIQTKQGKIDVSGEIISKDAPREFEKFGKKGKVCNAVLKDKSGKITLWNEEVDSVNVGDKVKISNGYCGEYQGEKQLSAGKFGKLEIVEGIND